MTHWKKLTNPNYIGSWDFQKDEERILTISRVVQEEVFNPSDNSKKHCIVAHFAEDSKPMVLNKTNCKTIQTLYNTPIIEEWAGCKVIVKVEKVRAFGKMEDGLRVKNQKPKQAPAQAKQEPPPMQVQNIHCTDCNEFIQGHNQHTAQQVAEKTEKKYGKPLCTDCGARAKERKETEHA